MTTVDDRTMSDAAATGFLRALEAGQVEHMGGPGLLTAARSIRQHMIAVDLGSLSFLHHIKQAIETQGFGAIRRKALEHGTPMVLGATSDRNLLRICVILTPQAGGGFALTQAQQKYREPWMLLPHSVEVSPAGIGLDVLTDPAWERRRPGKLLDQQRQTAFARCMMIEGAMRAVEGTAPTVDDVVQVGEDEVPIQAWELPRAADPEVQDGRLAPSISPSSAGS